MPRQVRTVSKTTESPMFYNLMQTEGRTTLSKSRTPYTKIPLFKRNLENFINIVLGKLVGRNRLSPKFDTPFHLTSPLLSTLKDHPNEKTENKVVIITIFQTGKLRS